MPYNIKRRKITVTVADGQTVGTANSESISGKIRGILYNIAQCSGTTTVTVALTDADGFTIHSKATIAENAKTAVFVDANNQPLQLPVSGIVTATVTQTNAQSGAAVDHVITLMMEE